MNRALWTQSLTEFRCPPWPCPVCHRGTISIVRKSLTYKETVESAGAHIVEDWSPEDTTYSFTAWAKCRNTPCGQEFAIAGTGGVAPEDVSDEDWQWEDYFSPLVCYPMPDMIQFPAKCPVDVQTELRSAFAVFWTNGAACAGRIRVALECLMDHLGVPKRRKGANGKYSDLNLHARVDAFAKHDPTVGFQLMALKWLGNTGSHARRVAKGDLLDALEIIEHALGEILDRRSARVAELAKKLTKKHGRK